MLRDVVVVPKHPQIQLAIFTTRKAIYEFLSMGLRLAIIWAARAPLLQVHSPLGNSLFFM